jgi:hypothetical protein
MAPRLSWILLGILAIVVAFFGFHIFQAYTAPAPSHSSFDPEVPGHPMVSQMAPIARVPEAVPMPRVPAQTEEELRETRPVSQTPPDIYYPDPEAVDPYEGSQNQATFGDNLRHPEQMVEMAPQVSSGNIVSSGLGAHVSYQGGNDSVQFDPEMAQNGGEFMSGIVAFDGSDTGVAYSAL